MPLFHGLNRCPGAAKRQTMNEDALPAARLRLAPQGPMEHRGRVSQRGFQLTFLRLAPGKERPTWDRLRQDPGKHVYKQFGYFDMLCLTESDKLQPTISDFMLDGIIDIIQLPCVAWGDVPNRPALAATDLAAYPLLAVQLLHLHTPAHSTLGRQFDAIQHLTECLDPALSSAVYTTLSYSEIAVITASEDIEALVANATNLALRSRSPSCQLSSSHTLYHVSYPLVLDRSDFPRLKGKIAAEFFASFHLPDERAALEHWERHVAEIFGPPQYVYGPHDLRGETKGPQELRRIAEAVYAARGMPFLETVTTILDPSVRDAALADTSEEGRVQQDDLLPATDLNELTTCARRLVESLGRTDALSLRLLNFLRTVHALAADPRARGAIDDLRFHLPFLLEQLRTLEAALTPNDRSIAVRQRLKGELVELVYLATKALEQRYPNVEAILEGRPAKSMHPLKTGLNRLILALGDLPRFIYESGPTRDARSDRRWSGFVTYEDEHGFYRLTGDVITCPMEALWYPLTRWATVTHEIAHGFPPAALGLDLAALHEAIAAAAENLEAADDDQLIEKMFDELLAQWIDFECFHDGAKEEFIRSTWYSLSSVPSVWWNTAEYLARTILVDVHDQSEALLLTDLDQRQGQLEEAGHRVVVMVGDLFDGEQLPGGLAELERAVPNAAFLAGVALPIAAALYAQRARLASLHAAVNRGERRRIEEETLAILSGRPVLSGLTNPLRTVIHLASRDYHAADRPALWGADLALIYSLADDHIVRLQTKPPA